MIAHLISPRWATRLHPLVLHCDRPESNSQFTISSGTTPPACALRGRNDRKIEDRKMKNRGPKGRRPLRYSCQPFSCRSGDSQELVQDN